MPAGPAELLSINGQRVRLAAWRGSGRVGVLSPLGEGGALGETGLAQALDHCRRRGFVEVLTAAIPEQDLPPFLAAGFVIRERLWLLAHPMTDLVAPPRVTRRGRRRDRGAAVAVDAVAFDDFWRLDERGLADARGATPTSRFQVVDRGGVVGYAVFGLAGHRGYLQRLAVSGAHRGQGLGTALVRDGLRWLDRRNVTTTFVNTQEHNTTALALYQQLGFRLLPHGLVVLTTELASGPR